MYIYSVEKGKLFTNAGQRLFLRIQDHVHQLLNKAGAVRMQEAISVATGDGWTLMACVDRMVELDELVELTDGETPSQHRVFVPAK